jgi:hypothetical protein
MALGGYLSARTARQILDQRITTEHYEIEQSRKRNGQNCVPSIGTRA